MGDWKENTLVGCAGAYMVVFWLCGLALHLWTAYIAYKTSGFIMTLATFSLPPFAEIYWLITGWMHAGFLNYYTIACGAWLALAIPFLWLSRD